MSTQTILIVDDEEDLRNVLDFNLRSAGFQTLLASTGRQALVLARAKRPDLILLDVMLPDKQGTEVCHDLRQNEETRSIPIIMVTARGSESDRVVGFEYGADDYVTKPFSVREIILRVKAVLKRTVSEISEPIQETKKDILFGELRMERSRHRVFYQEKEIPLTATEFRLLESFLHARGRVQTRDALLNEVWGEDINVTRRTVDTHVKRLREKLGEAEQYLETVRGVGYRFAEDP